MDQNSFWLKNGAKAYGSRSSSLLSCHSQRYLGTYPDKHFTEEARGREDFCLPQPPGPDLRGTSRSKTGAGCCHLHVYLDQALVGTALPCEHGTLARHAPIVNTETAPGLVFEVILLENRRVRDRKGEWRGPN